MSNNSPSLVILNSFQDLPRESIKSMEILKQVQGDGYFGMSAL